MSLETKLRDEVVRNKALVVELRRQADEVETDIQAADLALVSGDVQDLVVSFVDLKENC